MSPATKVLQCPTEVPSGVGCVQTCDPAGDLSDLSQNRKERFILLIVTGVLSTVAKKVRHSSSHHGEQEAEGPGER